MKNLNDFTVYNGIQYPLQTFSATIDNHPDDEWVHTYQIAPECLLDALMEGSEDYEEEGFDGDEAEIDDIIYHYVEDQYWGLPLEVICKAHLKLPMTLILE